MDVFLSWSGARSHEVAKAFESWLGDVIQAVQPWISSEIEKGSRWNMELTDRLEKSKIGIICLTKDNLSKPWILFEAGALSKKREAKESHVCTFLLDISDNEVEFPLAQFQHTKYTKDDVMQLMKTINKKVEESGEASLSEVKLEANFERLWRELDEKLTPILTKKGGNEAPRRNDRDILLEIAELSRSQNDRITQLENYIKANRVVPFTFIPSVTGAAARVLSTPGIFESLPQTSSAISKIATAGGTPDTPIVLKYSVESPEKEITRQKTKDKQ